MKVTNTIFALAFAAATAAAGGNYVASSPPAIPAPQPPAVVTVIQPAPQPPAVVTIIQSVPMNQISIIVADFMYSPTSGGIGSQPALPTPMPVITDVPAVPGPAYVASPPPVVPQPAQPGVTVIVPQPAQPSVTVILPQPPQPSVTEVVPSAPPAVTEVVPSVPPAVTEVVPSAPPAVTEVVPGAPPAPTPVPTPAPTVPATPSYQASKFNKRSIEQSAINNLVNGNGAMVFNINGQTYMLLRLPVSIPQASQAAVPLHKRDTPSNLIDDATTKNLGSEALLYEVLGKVFARVILPANAHVGISQPQGADALGNLLKRDLLNNILGEVIASAVAPLNIVANINPDEDGNGLVPNLIGAVSATIQASPTVTAHIFDADDYSGDLLKRDLVPNLLR
ncbi:hypothetical protein DL89DRAFT_20406 [Linderina pennispora]|uniref:FAS1 domain-containing protein n=1 Tax=Linderina pennispora TaxID=61395 RepID=A0A1Y1WM50_9FUNG|nr:uncharacterized protein DL89DRAFT_20406 [Linderina pennispora]ORX74650.1 hypothetical protein DL89DRAFT_20406 [Linderina pennispora]